MALFVLGYLASWWLYTSRNKKFYGSSLWAKVMFWIPLFGVYLVYVFAPLPWYLLPALWVLILSLREIKRHIVKPNRGLVIGYGASFVVATALVIIAPQLVDTHFSEIMLTIAFASVLGDVLAFFMGNLLGKHHLPSILNNHKSWEGVLGELLGAFIGTVLAIIFLPASITLWIWVPIGFGTALGDLANSYIKRRLGIKDWGSALPGHGGYLDRFASLYGATTLTLLAIYIHTNL